MILIADSGSTKTQWAVVNDGAIEYEVFTSGINPFYQSLSDVKHLIENELVSEIDPALVTAIFFYGAGCAFEEKKAIVRDALVPFFTHAKIEIESDLLAAARGLLKQSSGIACILGTGSNSCYYNGSTIEWNVSPLGFILGDEGSGAVLVKHFMGDCLKNQLPESIKTAFFAKYDLSPATVLENVYKKPFPNRYLAQFAPFLSENLAQPEINKLVFESFVSFFKRNVHQYDYQNNETSFVGSVAYYFEPVLRLAAIECNVKIGRIFKSPMNGLVEFHS